MRRSVLLLALLITLPLGACNRDSAAPPAAQTQAEETAPAPAPAKKKPKAKAKARPRSNAAREDQYAFLRSSDPGARRITYDLIEWYEGAAARSACKADGEKPGDNDWCVGWYIRNNNPRLRTLVVDPNAPLRLHDGKKTDLQQFAAAAADRVIRFEVDANRVMAARVVYTP